jgi:hypothetical protein
MVLGFCWRYIADHYKSHRAGQAELELRTKEIAAMRVRYGHRRVHVLLRREGRHINLKKATVFIAK